MSTTSWHTFALALIGACWALWGIVWFAGALYNAEHAPAVRRRVRRGYGWLAALLVFWLLARSLGGEWRPLRQNSVLLRLVGAALLVAGTAFTMWARAVLGTMWSGSVVAKEHHVLRTSGPYGITRHPIYTGMLAMLLGSALLDDLGPWVVALVVAAVVLVVKVREEERLMSETFPAEYEQYRRRVPQLIPGAHWLTALWRR
jgi:protein-S-isoprenylcysteine O-methyltransferase Ste14